MPSPTLMSRAEMLNWAVRNIRDWPLAGDDPLTKAFPDTGCAGWWWSQRGQPYVEWELAHPDSSANVRNLTKADWEQARKAAAPEHPEIKPGDVWVADADHGQVEATISFVNERVVLFLPGTVDDDYMMKIDEFLQEFKPKPAEPSPEEKVLEQWKQFAGLEAAHDDGASQISVRDLINFALWRDKHGS